MTRNELIKKQTRQVLHYEETNKTKCYLMMKNIRCIKN